ncbi:unnamed protein product [Echinostoma caproni]|uniref:Casein kinase I n=1 Tax=Echinostoma caproni TaxID=27848 RepID=A0A183A596_9TREM|nr:unnamed protein product [Echinostoma caproni]
MLIFSSFQANTKKQKYERIYERKVATSPEQLCKGYAFEFEKYLHYARALSFECTPDYQYLRGMFRRLFQSLDYSLDYLFDWTLLRTNTLNSEAAVVRNPNEGNNNANNNTTSNNNNNNSNANPNAAANRNHTGGGTEPQPDQSNDVDAQTRMILHSLVGRGHHSSSNQPQPQQQQQLLQQQLNNNSGAVQSSAMHSQFVNPSGSGVTHSGVYNAAAGTSGAYGMRCVMPDLRR